MDNVRRFAGKYFKTDAGKRLLGSIFGLSED